MSIRSFIRGMVAASLVAVTGLSANAGSFVQPTLTGTTASGLQWSAVATGTALPVTGTSAAAGSPGAVVYWDTTTGQMQVDPKGLDLTTLIITYTTGTVNVTGTSPGPFVYPSGTTTNSFSPTTGTPKTFPAVTAVSGLAPTTFAARVGVTIGAPLGPSLATSGDPGNIASTTGYFNQPWAFPIELVASGSNGLMTISNFATIGQTTNANINKLGYGVGRATFQYSANGIVGNQVGAVIPVNAVPEPSTIALAAIGLGLAGGLDYRRRKSRRESATASTSANG
ncbi:MAG: PEP-CTERM sorting domain-containing protein [Planctomycetaceae bacterium]